MIVIELERPAVRCRGGFACARCGVVKARPNDAALAAVDLGVPLRARFFDGVDSVGVLGRLPAALARVDGVRNGKPAAVVDTADDSATVFEGVLGAVVAAF